MTAPAQSQRVPWPVIALVVVTIVTIVLLSIRAFQPPVPLAKMESVQSGMSPGQVRNILGEPTKEYPSRSYVVRGTNYQTGSQWTYTRFLTFGYVNVLFDTNGMAEHAHYETF